MLGVNGLFGHIQRNNAKTLALMALFLLLVEGAQVALRMMPLAMITNVNRQLPPWPAGPSMVDHHSNGTFSSKRSARPETIATTLERPVLPAFSTEGNGAPVPKDAEGKSRSAPLLPPELVRPEVGKYLEGPILAVISNPWLIALIGGLIYILGTCYSSARLIAFETRARPLQRKDAPQLYDLVENLAISIGLPCPRIEVIESPALNAYAAGFFPTSSTIAVTRGLIQTLTRDELEAVLAHELTHIRDRDVRLMVMVRACAHLLLPLSRAVIERIKRKPFVDCMLGILLIAYLGPTFALLFAAIFAAVAGIGYAVRFAISQTREFTADAGAIELTKNPAALISALRKVALNDALPLKGYATRAMMFSSTIETWFRTHPSIDDRIAAIKLHGGVAEHENHDFLMTPRARTAAADPQVAFGRKRVMHGLANVAPPQSMMSQVRPAPIIPAAQNGTFGRRGAARIATGRNPGERPIAEPRITAGMEATDTNRLSSMDQLNAIGAKVISVPITLLRYFFACSIAFGLVMTLITHSPPLGLAAAAFCVWLLVRNLSRAASRVTRRFGNA